MPEQPPHGGERSAERQSRPAGSNRIPASQRDEIRHLYGVDPNHGRKGVMSEGWPSLNYPQWSATCDTLHAHAQVLGKLAVVLAPPEPQLQHAALRLTARGFETLPL